MREIPDKILSAIALIVILASATFAQSSSVRNTSAISDFSSGSKIGELYDISSPGGQNTNQAIAGNASTSHTGAKIPQNQTYQASDFYKPVNPITGNNINTQNTMKMPTSWELEDIGTTGRRIEKSPSDTQSQIPYTFVTPLKNEDNVGKNIDKLPDDSKTKTIDSTIQNPPSSGTANKQVDSDSQQLIDRLQKQLDDMTKSIEKQYSSNADKQNNVQQESSQLSAIPSQSRSKTTVKSSPSPALDTTQSKISLPKESPVSARRNLPIKNTKQQEKTESKEALKNDKFEEHFKNGLDYLKAGRYKKASESFTIAAMYHPDDYIVLANLAHCLFADSQYLSSAIFLIRAIELKPDYLNQQISLEDSIGDMEQIVSCRSQLEQLVELSNAPGLQFLLGYIYYRTGKIDDTRRIIETLEPQMPNSNALSAMKKTIDSIRRTPD
jgi:TolA-binding protein